MDGTRHRAGSEARRLAIGVGIIAVLGTALGAWGIGHREFWHDEWLSLLYATAPEGVAAALRAGANPPLYFVILRAWIAVFGASESAVRALSTVFSTLTTAAFAGGLHALGLTRRAVLWSAAIFALAPLKLFYARESRPYSLMLLLLCGALWALAGAVRSGGVRRWAVYTLLFALGLYTHNLMILMSGACLVAGWLLARDRAARMSLLAAQAAAFVIYVPWVFTLARQPYANQSRWMVSYWSATPPALAIPRSLLGFPPGGGIPRYISWPSPPVAIQALSASVALVAIAFALTAIFLDDRGAERIPSGHEPPGRIRASSVRKSRIGDLPMGMGVGNDVRAGERTTAGALLVLLFAPLAVLWLESVAGRPIYIVGRYDLAALPAFCALAGWGFAKIQHRLEERIRPSAAAVALAAVLGVLGAGTLVPRYRADLAPERHPARDRVALFESLAGTEDLVVAVDLSASNALFLLRQRRPGTAFATFPTEILHHFGWFNVEDSLARGRPALIEEARSLLRSHLAAHPAARLWVFLHPPALTPPSTASFRNPHQDLLEIFLSACRLEGLREEVPEGADAAAFHRVGLLMLQGHVEGDVVGSTPDRHEASGSGVSCLVPIRVPSRAASTPLPRSAIPRLRATARRYGSSA